jgi:hypothetical protein
MVPLLNGGIGQNGFHQEGKSQLIYFQKLSLVAFLIGFQADSPQRPPLLAVYTPPWAVPRRLGPVPCQVNRGFLWSPEKTELLTGLPSYSLLLLNTFLASKMVLDLVHTKQCFPFTFEGKAFSISGMNSATNEWAGMISRTPSVNTVKTKPQSTLLCV